MGTAVLTVVCVQLYLQRCGYSCTGVHAVLGGWWSYSGLYIQWEMYCIIYTSVCGIVRSVYYDGA